MSMRKLIAPQITLLILLGLFWVAGVDTVVQPENDRENLQKYLQVQRRVIDNYYGDTDLSTLYRESIIGMVEALEDSTLDVFGTPIDTSAAGFTAVDNLRDSFTRFEEAYLYVASTFPDAEMTKVTEKAISRMMDTLDPYSVYIEPKTSDRIQEEFAGKFQGIGIEFNIIEDTITVVTAISGGPSDLLGIMSGDRIVAIDDSSAVGFNNEDVIQRLRGEKGTEVVVDILRPRSSSPLRFTIVRDDIPITTVDSQYMLDEVTGYVKVNRFAATTHSEFMDAVDSLSERGMERLVLDLRNNPGGYLSQAIAMAEEFFPRNTVLVSTKSRHTRFNQEARSQRDGRLMELPVIVLVNEGSASASEIVSGAIQDHDRGLVVGSRTFGKGLVQQQYELVDRSNIRVTISRYLTPSGRLIQKPFDGDREVYAYEFEKEHADSSTDASTLIDQVPDSLQFLTSSGRSVFGGGGITPDFIVKEDTSEVGYLINFMVANRVDFNFVRDYLDENGDEFKERWENSFHQFRSDFEWSDEDLQDLRSRMMESGLILDETVTNFEASKDTLVTNEALYEEHIWMNKARMKAQLARQVWGSEAFYPVINDHFNDDLEEAMKLWDEVARLEELSAGLISPTDLRFRR